MTTFEWKSSDLNMIGEGKTKEIHAIGTEVTAVLIRSKDKITAFDGTRKDDFEGKAVFATATAAHVFEFLQHCGVRTHYLTRHSPTEFVAERCSMIPLEFVGRRVATGSFLKRNPGVPEGFRFAPIKLEMFYKDPQWADEQRTDEMVVAAKMHHGGVTVDARLLAHMLDQTRLVFELIERAWAREGCALIDMKVEFGVNADGHIVLADVIDNDSWRVWPHGDKRLMLDKQIYRNLAHVTDDAMAQLKHKYELVADYTKRFVRAPHGRAVVVMDSVVEAFGLEIARHCEQMAIAVDLRVCSAHKGTQALYDLIAEYEQHAHCVFVAVAGRSNGLGPVLAGNSRLPVINCPPGLGQHKEDVWSSLHTPGGVGCMTVMGAEQCATAVATILATHDLTIWGRMSARQAITRTKLRESDAQLLAKNAEREARVHKMYGHHHAEATGADAKFNGKPYHL